MNIETAKDAYQAIIDGIVKDVLPWGSGGRLSMHGILSKAPSDNVFNDHIKTLTETQRKFLVCMLRNERDGTIHDLLAALDWWIDCQEVKLTFKGEPMQCINGGLHYDYVGRREDLKEAGVITEEIIPEGETCCKTSRESDNVEDTIAQAVNEAKAKQSYLLGSTYLMSYLSNRFPKMKPDDWDKIEIIISKDGERCSAMFDLAHECETLEDFINRSEKGDYQDFA